MRIQRAFLFLKGKPIQSILHILLMVIIASALLFGIIFKETGEYITSGGNFYYSVALTTEDYENGIPINIIEQLSKNPNVISHNYSIIQEVHPLNFKNWVDYYDLETLNYANQVELNANLNIKFSDIFSQNIARLVEGSFPNENEHGVIVEKSLAEYNSIHVGDMVSIKTKDVCASVLALQVTGIYELDSPIETTELVGGQMAHVVSRYSRLYTNIYSIKSYLSENAINYVNFYTSEKENIPLIISDFQDKIEDNALKVSDSTDTTLIFLNDAVESMYQYYNWIIYILIMASLLIFFLFSIYTQHKNIYETAVLSLLGKQKKEILFQNALNVFILSSISNVLTIISAFSFSKQIGLFWISMATRDYKVEVLNFSFQAQQIELINNYKMNGWKIIIIISIIYLISLLISFIYSLYTLRLTPRKIMDRM